MLLWADPTDLATYQAVTGDLTATEPDDDGSVSTALAVASEVLSLATAYLIHPAGTSTEEYIATRHVRRFSPVYAPVVSVTSILTVDHAGATSPIGRPWQLVGSTIYFRDRVPSIHRQSWGGSWSPWRIGDPCGPDDLVYRITYDFASTLSRGARSAVLAYAHELWLAEQDPSECSLPERVTSISREGLEISLLTPTDYMDKGKVGLPRVDAWLAMVNPKQAKRPSAVYTPDSPPGVNTRLSRRP